MCVFTCHAIHKNQNNPACNKSNRRMHILRSMYVCMFKYKRKICTYIYMFMCACVSIYEQICAFRKHTQYLNTYVHMHIHIFTCMYTYTPPNEPASWMPSYPPGLYSYTCVHIYILILIHAGTTNAQLMQARSRGRKHRLLLEHLRHEVDDMAPVVVGVLPGPDNMWIQCTS